MSGGAVIALPIASIAVGERVGFYHADHAARLAALIAIDGQHDPIHVRRNGNAAKVAWTLVAGLHRLRAAELAGLTTVDAVQVADASADAATLKRLEVSENLDHRDLRPIERSRFIAARAEAEERIDHPGRVGEGQAERAARARWDASATMAGASDWRGRTAEATGVSLRMLERYQRLHRSIVVAFPDLAERLNAHALGESLSSMTQVATIRTEDGRRALIETIIAHPEVKSVDEASVIAGQAGSKGKRATENPFGLRLTNDWGRMKLADRRGAALWIAGAVTPGIAEDMIAAFKARGLLL